jgi:hypothetical protein
LSFFFSFFFGKEAFSNDMGKQKGQKKVKHKCLQSFSTLAQTGQLCMVIVVQKGWEFSKDCGYMTHIHICDVSVMEGRERQVPVPWTTYDKQTDLKWFSRGDDRKAEKQRGGGEERET